MGLFIEDRKIASMQCEARALGFMMFEPQADMYGGYECSIQNLKTGIIRTVMNCSSPFDAAMSVIKLIKNNEISTNAKSAADEMA